MEAARFYLERSGSPMFLTEFDGGKAVIEPEAIIGRIKEMP